MKQILIDEEKCMACHSCELACCIAHSTSKTLYGAVFEQNGLMSRIHVEAAGKGRGFPLSCRHCQDPQCVRACVTRALHMNADGVILCNEKLCIGCLMCFIACPFGAIEETRKKQGSGRTVQSISKCDLCVATGDEPACVTACMTKALVFEDPDVFSKGRRIKYLVEMSASRD